MTNAVMNFFYLSAAVITNVFFILFLTAGYASATGFIKVGNGGSDTYGEKISDVTLFSETIDIRFDNQMAKTRVVQIFKNNTPRILEGEYIFPLPFGANIVSFATWDDGVKLNGVIMEKVKARKIYDDIVSQLKDPGLLENIGSNTFSARIFPIPAYGTKRLEMEYVEYLPLLNRTYSYVYPLYSEDMEVNARKLSITVELSSDFNIVSPEIYFKSMKFSRNADGNYFASCSAVDFNDKIDFKLSFSFDLSQNESKTLIYKDNYNNDEKFYFLTSFKPFEIQKQTGAEDCIDNNRTAVFLIDTSYSMRGEKKDIVKKLFSALNVFEGYARFNVIFFDSFSRLFAVECQAIDSANFKRLNDHIDKIRPFGDSKPLAAISLLVESIDSLSTGEVNAILISDGLFQTSQNGLPLSKTLKSVFENSRSARSRLTISALAVGAGSENDRLAMISNIFMGEFRELKNINDSQVNFVLAAILKSMAGGLVKNITFKPAPEFDADVYPRGTQNINFDSECYFTGRLNKKFDIRFDLNYEFKGANFTVPASTAVTAKNGSYIALLWARRRVDYLTAYMDEYGENEQMRKEIVELSKRFNFVTKYTSFLAVPPSVLRPRRIKPGDPEIAVSAPVDSKSVIIKLPFSEPLKAEYDVKKQMFIARFTAPAHIKDGRYQARVIIMDKFGREIHHALDFYIDSTPPVVYAKCSPEIITPGCDFIVSASASPDTASIKAKILEFNEILDLKYDKLSKLSLAHAKAPINAAPGIYKMEIEAIDHAGNRSVKYVEYTVALNSAASGDIKKMAGDESVK